MLDTFHKKLNSKIICFENKKVLDTFHKKLNSRTICFENKKEFTNSKKMQDIEPSKELQLQKTKRKM